MHWAEGGKGTEELAGAVKALPGSEAEQVLAVWDNAKGTVNQRVSALARFVKAVEGEPQRFDWWGRRKDGSLFPKEVVLKRSVYFGQDVVLAVARNISDRVEAEEALRRSEEHYRRLIENSSDVATILGPDGVNRYQSPAIKYVLGYTPEEMLGTSAFDRIHPDDVPACQEVLGEVMRNPGTTRSVEFRYRHRDSRLFKDISDELEQAKMLSRLKVFGTLGITSNAAQVC